MGMTLFLCSGFVLLAAVFGMFLLYARPENIERPILVGSLTSLTAFVAGWLLWLQSHQGNPDKAGSAVLFALIPVAGFALGRGIDAIMGPRRATADERQATLGAELSD